MRKCDKKSAPSIGFETSATTNTQINDLRNDELLNVKCVCPCTASERPSAAFKQTREDANKQFNNLANDKGINDIEAPVSIKKSMVKSAMRKAAKSCRALPDVAVAGAPRCLLTALVSYLGSLQGSHYVIGLSCRWFCLAIDTNVGAYVLWTHKICGFDIP